MQWFIILIISPIASDLAFVLVFLILLLILLVSSSNAFIEYCCLLVFSIDLMAYIGTSLWGRLILSEFNRLLFWLILLLITTFLSLSWLRLLFVLLLLLQLSQSSRILLVALLKLIMYFFFLDTSEWVFNVSDGALCWLKILRAPLAKYLEATDFGLIVVNLGWENDGFGVVLYEGMREASTEVGSVNVYAAELWQVNFFASGAENLEPRSLKSITEADWKHLLSIAEGTRTVSVDAR